MYCDNVFSFYASYLTIPRLLQGSNSSESTDCKRTMPQNLCLVLLLITQCLRYATKVFQ
jgi:hypothetical protein